jgi:hypothetical protein
MTLIDSSKAAAYIQPGGPGYTPKVMPKETTFAGQSGGGRSFESDFTGGGDYVGTRQTSNPERWSGDMMSRATALSRFRDLTVRNCLSNLYALWGCEGHNTNFSNFDFGLVYIDSGVTSYGQDQNQVQGTENFDPKLMDTASFTSAIREELFPVSLLDRAISGTQVVEDVIAVSQAQCPGYCGPDNDGNQEFIAIREATAPATAPVLFYSDDGGLTWTSIAITGATTSNANPHSLSIAGENLIVSLGGTDGGFGYIPLSGIRAGTAVFTKANGYTGSGARGLFAVSRDIVVGGLNTGAIYLSRDGGYSYELIDSGGTLITGLVYQVHARDENRIYISSDVGEIVLLRNLTSLSQLDDGTTFSNATAVIHVPAGAGRGLELFVGDSGGDIWHSTDGGVTYVQQSFDQSGVGSIQKITSSGTNSHIIWVAQQNAGGTAGRILRDFSGGAFAQSAVVVNTFTVPGDRIVSIAASDANTAVAVGGTAATSSFIGKVSR